MTGGVVLVLGPMGLNFGSGMTGGLAYVMRAEAEDVLHREFVALADVEAEEQLWLRRVLEAHVQFTRSPRATRLLSKREGLPLVRVQPVHFQGTIADTWRAVLERLQQSPLGEPLLIAPELPAISQAALHA
jgi:glutamate synthase (NADPH/NADH) large chain